MQGVDLRVRAELRGLGRALLRQVLLTQFGATAALFGFGAVRYRDALGGFGFMGGGMDLGAAFQYILMRLELDGLLNAASVVLTMLFSVLGGLVVARFARRAGVSFRERFAAPSGETPPGALALCVALFGLNMLSGLVVLATEGLFNTLGYSILLPSIYQGDAPSWWLTFVYAVLVGPIVEETVYRGAVIGVLRKYGERFALAASAAVFALMHGNLAQFFPTLVIGWVLGYVYLRTGSLKLSVFLHMGNNLLATLISEFALPLLGAGAVFADWALTLGLGAFGLWWVWRFSRRRGLVDEREAFPHPLLYFFSGGAMAIYMTIHLLSIIGMVGNG